LNSLERCPFLVFLRGKLVGKYHKDTGGTFLIEPLKTFVDQPGARLIALFGETTMVVCTTRQIIALIHAGLDNVAGIMFDAHPIVLSGESMLGHHADAPCV